MSSSFDLIVIGSGPGGYVAAIKAAQLGMSVACVEKEKLGGTCLNVGCIPSKSLLHASETYYRLKTIGEGEGILAKELGYDFETMQKNKNDTVSSFNQGIAYLFKKYKVTHLQGTASFEDTRTIRVEKDTYTAKHFIIATGSEPISLPFLPLDEQTVVSSTGALALSKVPETMVVVGAGIIGLELGSVYARLGTKVEVVEFLDRITPTLDTSLSQALQKELEKQGMTFHLQEKVTGYENGVVTTENGLTLKADVVLVSIGRKAYTEGLCLEKAEVKQTEKGQIAVNESFQTSCPHIYAIGDVIDGPMLAHKASEEGIAVAELLAGKKPSLEYITIPSVVYTDPEVASVGFTEEELKGTPYTAATFPFSANSRAKCVHQSAGFVKLIAHKETKHLLGAHIIGAHAGELIQELALALKLRATAHDIAETSHAHPTLSEAIKEAALALLSNPIHM